MTDKPTEIERLQDELGIAKAWVEESREAPNSYGHGFDSGRLDGLRWALELLTGKETS